MNILELQNLKRSLCSGHAKDVKGIEAEIDLALKHLPKRLRPETIGITLAMIGLEILALNEIKRLEEVGT